MTRPRLKILLCCLALCLAMTASAVYAQTGPDKLLEGMEYFYAADFNSARKSLSAALASGDLSPGQRAKTHFYLGQVELALGNEAKTLEYFQAAKGEDPSFTPSGSPQVMQLWEQAAPAPAAPAGGQPVETALPPERAIVFLAGDNLMVAYGKKHGIKPGDRFAVVQIQTFQHNIAGTITRSVKVAEVEVARAFDDNSDVMIVQGGRGDIIAKIQASADKCLPIKKLARSAETAPVDTGEQPQPASNKIAVFPPGIKDPDMNFAPPGWPEKYSAAKVVDAIARIPGLPKEPFAVTREQLTEFCRQDPEFKVPDYLKEAGSGSAVIQSLVELDADNLMRPPLNATEKESLARVLNKLGVEYALFWGFYFDPPGQGGDFNQKGKILLCIYKKGISRPVVAADELVSSGNVDLKYPKYVQEMVENHQNQLR